MGQTVIGFFDNAADAQRAVERLQSLGISRSDIDLSENSGSDTVSSDREHESGIKKFFKSLFGDDNDDAERYSHVGQRSTVVSVYASSEEQAEQAADLLDDCGAIDVDERSREYGYASASDTATRRTGRTDEEDITLNRIEEDLEVGKREVESGSVRVRSRIVERPVEENLRLREEHVHVERTPVNRPLTEADRASMQDRDIEIREHAEVPVVNKEARVVEEVRVSKDVTERNETIRDTVRDTEIDVDRDNDTHDRDGLDRDRRGLSGDRNDI
ncbi:MAG TPA: YsnF/AvaK domain-containing protein [Flavisolibacter sp.]|nr:YsnF/AvaK domain-containing protein [Flavisolibacter sp.]